MPHPCGPPSRLRPKPNPSFLAQETLSTAETASLHTPAF